MTKDLLTKWLDWLNNPENKQVQGAMHTDEGYCCLGGLCVVAGREVPLSVDDDTGLTGANYMFCRTELSGASNDLCIDMNDALGKSFPQIAAWAKKHIIPTELSLNGMLSEQ